MCWIPSNWQNWAALFTIVQVVVVVIALLYARHQLSEATRSRELNATTQLLTEIGAPKIREARGYVLYDLVPHFDVSKLKKDEIDLIGSVAVAYDPVGYMVLEKLIPGKALYQFHGDDIGLVWKKVEPLVRYYQEKATPKRPHYCSRFEQLATEWLPDMEGKYGDKNPPPTVQSGKP